MKKSLSVLLVLTMLIAMLAGCGTKPSQPNNATTPSPTPSSTKAPAEASKASDKPIVLRVAHQSNQTESIHLGFVKFKEEIEKANVGITVNIFPAKQLVGSDSDAIEACQLGEIDLTSVAEMQFAPFVRQFFVFNSNYLFKNLNDAKAKLEGAPGDALKKATIDAKVKVRVATFFGGSFRAIFNKVRPIRKPSDLAGIKMRTADNPINVAELKALGSLPTVMAGGEIWTGFQQGTIEGFISAITSGVQQGYLELLPYVSNTNQTIYLPTILVNDAKYNSFSDAQKKAFDAAIKSATDYQWGLTAKEADAVGAQLKDLEAKGKCKFADLTDAEREEFKKVMVAATKDMVVKNCGKEIEELFRK